VVAIFWDNEMNFDFSEEQRGLQGELRDYLADASPLGICRKSLEANAGIDTGLWRAMGELGWLGIRIPEKFGGSGLGALELALAAEEVGRALAPIPFGSSICGVVETLLANGSEDQHARWLPGLATGEQIGALALAEPGIADPAAPAGVAMKDGKLSGRKVSVADGAAATVAIVSCRHEGEPRLTLVALDQPGVVRALAKSIDPSRSVATLSFDGAEAELIGGKGAIDVMLLRSATYCAFEQLGGADSIFAITREFMDFRQAFDKPISSYQALKHRMADLYTALELARANVYYAAWAVSAGSPELAEAASCARIAASQAFQLATEESIQLHGGIGFTWESDCHLFYRRAKWLSAWLGAPDHWRERLVAELDATII
jgi:alkylation response protein AidB-like acyl-CoA dehydrogenase